ncbi:MAG TPA: hypothetical protein ENI80_00330 [Acidiferrobacteraceae bacterium]|nr:hypothetical protein [Acidiferrobacteraceae bacterium]
MKRMLILGVLIWSFGLSFGAMAGDDQLLYKQTASKQLVLHQPVRIPADTATAYFQGGAVVSANDLDEFSPYCALVVASVSETSQQVPAGRYRIVKLFPYDEEQSSLTPIRVAGINGWVVASGDANTDHSFMTRIKLASITTPKLLYLDCGALWDYSIGKHITSEQFNYTVGSWLSLAP